MFIYIYIYWFDLHRYWEIRLRKRPPDQGGQLYIVTKWVDLFWYLRVITVPNTSERVTHHLNTQKSKKDIHKTIFQVQDNFFFTS